MCRASMQGHQEERLASSSAPTWREWSQAKLFTSPLPPRLSRVLRLKICERGRVTTPLWEGGRGYCRRKFSSFTHATEFYWAIWAAFWLFNKSVRTSLYRSAATWKILLQGSANPQTPGSENKRIKSCVLLPAAGRRTQLFHLIFTEPGVCGFAEPCKLFYSFGRGSL